MAEAKVPGGRYKDAQGEGWHDANGKPVPAPSKEEVAESVAEAEKQLAFEEAVKAEVQRQVSEQVAGLNLDATVQAEVQRILAERAAVEAPTGEPKPDDAPPADPKGDAPALGDANSTADLVKETESRARKQTGK